MRTLSTGLFLAGLGALVVVCSVAVHPFGSVKRIERLPYAGNDLDVPSPIGTVLSRSCIDCHSNNTAWPWYSYVAPVSWLVERDVEKGRRHLNFSRWNQYTLADRSRLLADLASAVKNHEMPLAQYTLVHRRAQLSDTERDLVYQWAREERKKVRAKIIRTSSAGKPAGKP